MRKRKKRKRSGKREERKEGKGGLKKRGRGMDKVGELTLKGSETCLVVSDTHIGDDGVNISTLIRLMDRHDYVILNGDIFELWLHKFKDIRDGPAKMFFTWLANNSDKFFYVVGNHDSVLWEMERYPFPLYDAVNVTSGKASFHCIHGHQFDKHNREPNIFVRMVVWFEYLINALFKTNIRTYLFERKTTFSAIPRKQKQRYLASIRSEARQYCIENSINNLIHGHTHAKNENRIAHPSKGMITVYDQGSFMDKISYVVIKDHGFCEVINHE